jgi:hypothetical protein
MSSDNLETAVQRPIVLTAAFDFKRVEKEANQNRRGGDSGKYKIFYRTPQQNEDNSMDQGDLAWRWKTGKLQSQNRNDVSPKTEFQQPPVSVNLRGSGCGVDKLKPYLSEITDDGAKIRQYFRDNAIVEGLVRHTVRWNDELVQQNGVAVLKGGTVGKVVNGPAIRAGQFCAWDAPLPGQARCVGDKELPIPDKLTLITVPLDNVCRLTLDMLINWCERNKCLSRDRATFIRVTKEKIKTGGEEFYTMEGKYLHNLYRSELVLEQDNKFMNGGVDPVSMAEYGSLTRRLNTIFTGFELRGNARTRAKWEKYSTMVDNDLYAECGMFLDAVSRVYGKCYMGNEPKGKMNVNVDY